MSVERGADPLGRWQGTAASARGSSHADAAPNQDAVLVEQFSDGADGRLWLAAVSDGHGGRRYVRSDTGSRLAVETARNLVAEGLRSEGMADLPALLRSVVDDVVPRWREEVQEHARLHPFEGAETDVAVTPAASGGTEDPTVVAYGATLLLALVGRQGVALAQIGDGDALVRVNGHVVRPVPGDDRLVAGSTTSLCLDSAREDFRFAQLPATAGVDLVLLTSDGYGNSFASSDWWRTLIGDMAWFVTEHGFEEYAAQLPHWLGESAAVGGDDASAVTLVLEPLVVDGAPPVVGEPDPPVTEVSPATTAGGVPAVAGVAAVGASPPAAAHDSSRADLAASRPVASAADVPVTVAARTLPDAERDRESVPPPPRPRRALRGWWLLILVALILAGTGWWWFGRTVGGSTEQGPVIPQPSITSTSPATDGSSGASPSPKGTGSQKVTDRPTVDDGTPSAVVPDTPTPSTGEIDRG